MNTRILTPRSERGMTLVEAMVALIVLSLGILAIGQLFPAGTRGQVSDRMLTQANYYAQQKVEDLTILSWTDAALTGGRHPSGTTNEPLGSNGQWQRFYQVTTMAAPLDNLKKVTVTVNWTVQGPRSVAATTYLRR